MENSKLKPRSNTSSVYLSCKKQVYRIAVQLVYSSLKRQRKQETWSLASRITVLLVAEEAKETGDLELGRRDRSPIFR